MPTPKEYATMRAEIKADPHKLKGAPLFDRLWSRVRFEEKCWVWTGGLWNGYGRISVNGRNVPCHRVAYEMLRGPIPAGLVADHGCRNRRCVNPFHIEPVTFAENARRCDRRDAYRTNANVCRNGHELTTANTRLRGRTRVCRKCSRSARRRSRGLTPRNFKVPRES